MKWFKLWTEAKSDPKLRKMTHAQRWIWLCLLCEATEQPDETLGTFDTSDMEYLSEVVIDEEPAVILEAIDKMVKFRMLSDLGNGHYEFTHYADRQRKPSDLPEATRDRKAKSREQSRPCHANVTPLSLESHAITEAEADKEAEAEVVAPARETAAAEPKASWVEVVDYYLAATGRIMNTTGDVVCAKDMVAKAGGDVACILRGVDKALARGKPIRTLSYCKGCVEDEIALRDAVSSPGPEWKARPPTNTPPSIAEIRAEREREAHG